jgi:hypothetical protein
MKLRIHKQSRIRSGKINYCNLWSNAGGSETISLKTVGLLRLMLQSGMLIPVRPNAVKQFLTDRILTDIVTINQ